VRDRFNYWYEVQWEQEPNWRKPLASWATEYEEWLDGDTRMDLILAPSTKGAQLAGRLAEIREALPESRVVDLLTIDAGCAVRPQRLLAGYLDFRLTWLPLQLTAPPEAMVVEMGDVPADLVATLERTKPEHVVVQVAPETSVQDVVDLLDVIRTACAAEVSLR